MAIKEAKKADLYPLPNPSVGAIVVNNVGNIVGRGYTQEYGGEHAESIALQEAGKEANKAILFCTLEPCHGVWPGKHQDACTSKIIKSGIQEVYIACMDRYPKIRGDGIQYLLSRGIKVYVLDEFQEECRILNECYEFLQSESPLNLRKLPFLSLKIAESNDKIMAFNNANRAMITGEKSKDIVHALRAKHQVLLTSSSTIHKDNPLLTVRNVDGVNPALCILDSNLSLDPNSKIFDPSYNRRILKHFHSQVLIVTDNRVSNHKVKKFQDLGVCVIKMEYNLGFDVEKLITYLRDKEIYSIMVEAGPRLSSEILNLDIYSHLYLFRSNANLGSGIGVDKFLSKDKISMMSKLRMGEKVLFKHKNIQIDDKDLLIQAYRHKIF